MPLVSLSSPTYVSLFRFLLFVYMCYTTHTWFSVLVSDIFGFFAYHISFIRPCLGLVSLHIGGYTNVFRLHICHICQIDTLYTRKRLLSRWKFLFFFIWPLYERFSLTRPENVEYSVVDTIILVQFHCNDRYIYALINTYLFFPSFNCLFNRKTQVHVCEPRYITCLSFLCLCFGHLEQTHVCHSRHVSTIWNRMSAKTSNVSVLYKIYYIKT